MTFPGLTPAAAWLLLAGVAALVLLLYVLKPSPRRVAVASSLVWQRVLEQRQRRPERWRWWLSLLLALAIALSMAFALTRPELAAIAGGGGDVLIVVDTSPSMGARGADGRTRLQHAAEQVARIVDGTGGGSRFLLADTTHQIRTPAFESRTAIGARVHQLAPGFGERAWFPELASLPGLRAQHQVWFVTDGVAAMDLPASVRVASVFRNADNVGITAFDVRAAPGDPRRHDAFVEITNASAGNKRVQLRIAGAGGTPLERSLRLAGGARESLVLDVSALGEGPLRANVASEGDGFALDDTAYGFLPGKSRVRVALVSPGNVALARALRTLPRVELQMVAPARAARLVGFDAAVFDRVTPDRLPGVPALLVAPRPTGWLGRAAGEISDTSVSGWDADHPLLSRADLRDVLIDRAIPLRPVAESAIRFDTIARGPEDEPLMLATREGPRLAVLAFALEASNFAQQPGFPAFLANAVDWLTSDAGAVARPLGQIAVPAKARVLNLEGGEVATREVPGASLFVASEPGLYTAMTRSERVRIAANLLDAGVTAVNASTLSSGLPSGVPGVPQEAGRFARIDPWVVLLAAAALLLALEWWSYNRRITL